MSTDKENSKQLSRNRCEEDSYTHTPPGVIYRYLVSVVEWKHDRLTIMTCYMDIEERRVHNIMFLLIL